MSDERGFWLAYYLDWSGMACFDSEILALRYAVEHAMQVFFVEWGNDLREATQPKEAR